MPWSLSTELYVNGVYNGKCKLIVQNRNFMTESDVRECIKDLKNKKCEGYDRIPLCMLIDSRDVILPALQSLFSSIYLTKKIPEQW